MKPTTAMLLTIGGIAATVILGRWYLLPVSLFTAFVAFGCGLETGRNECKQRVVKEVAMRLNAFDVLRHQGVSIRQDGTVN